MTETGSASAGPVSSYLASLSPDVAGALGAVVARAHELIPELDEVVSYAMPALLHRGKALLSVMETKKHLAYYPYSGKVVSLVAAELPGFEHSSGAVRFSIAQPLPPAVVDRLILTRRDQIDAQLDR